MPWTCHFRSRLAQTRYCRVCRHLERAYMSMYLSMYLVPVTDQLPTFHWVFMAVLCLGLRWIGSWRGVSHIYRQQHWLPILPILLCTLYCNLSSSHWNTATIGAQVAWIILAKCQFQLEQSDLSATLEVSELSPGPERKNEKKQWKIKYSQEYGYQKRN